MNQDLNVNCLLMFYGRPKYKETQFSYHYKGFVGLLFISLTISCFPQVTLNGANHGFPVELGEAFAFRQANGRIGLGTTYGLMAYCTTKLEVCSLICLFMS